MNANSMNTENTTSPNSIDYTQLHDRVTCPVCRAGQEPNPICRRCSADLELYLQCLISRQRAERQREAALESGDLATAQRMQEYLHWLGWIR